MDRWVNVMPDQPSSFRDFGILPEGLQPPEGTIRAYFSTGRLIGQYIGTSIVAVLGLGIAYLFVWLAPMPLSLLGCAAAFLGFGAFVHLITHNDYRWVELDGDTLRARHLYTGRTIERSVDEIDSSSTMFYQARRLETVIIEKWLGRIKGIEIRFRDRRTPLRILRADPAMTNAEELIQGVLYRLSQAGELDADVENVDGKPLLRNIHWKGQEPGKPPSRTWKMALTSLMLLGLVFGTILGLLGVQEQELRDVGSVPPQELTATALIKDGPGANRHVIVTDFRAAGYAIGTTNKGDWSQVWIALFPKDAPRNDIKIVFSSKVIRSPGMLRQTMDTGRVKGICSATLRTSWGTVLGPELEKANPGCTLTAAWSIDELREIPSAASVQAITTGGTVCLAAVVLLSLVLFWKA